MRYLRKFNESNELDKSKEILSDYFIDFEDGGKVVIEDSGNYNSKYFSSGGNVIEVYMVTIFTNETYISKKINWKRLSYDWDILGFKQQNYRVSNPNYVSLSLWKRSFRIVLCRKGEVTNNSPIVGLWYPGYGPIGPISDRTKRKLGII